MSRARDLPRLVSSWPNGAKFREQVRETNGERTFFHPVNDAKQLPVRVVN